MKKYETRLAIILLIVSICVLSLSVLFLILGDELAIMFDVIGIRIAALFISFAAFCSTSAFSYLIYRHNKTISRVNDDINKRAESFRELQFVSSNYSIIEFKDRMLMYPESDRYINKYIKQHNMDYHLFASDINYYDVIANPENYDFITLKIPFEVVEGKVVANIKINKLRFERDGVNYYFASNDDSKESIAFILYDEYAKQKNMIVNLVVAKHSDFYNYNQINNFSKLKIYIKITSLLGVEVKGVSELYFTIPEDTNLGINIYLINAFYFRLSDMPVIGKLHFPEK